MNIAQLKTKEMLLGITIIIGIVFYLFLIHSDPSKDKKYRLYVVSTKPLSNTLYYTGVIEPLNTLSIISPIEGIIKERYFHYGDSVQDGQILFSVFSEKFLNTYKMALLQYLKTKTDYLNNKSQFDESEFLIRNQLISKDEFKSKKTSYLNAQLALIQAKEELENLLKQARIKEDKNIYTLNIENVKDVTEALHFTHLGSDVKVVSPVGGVVLLPGKNSKTEYDNKPANAGNVIKQGDLLAEIGDLNGIKIQIVVDEFNINQIKIGQRVQVTGAAFPDLILGGRISSIDHQGRLNQNNMSVFAVEIQVPQLSKREKDIIHIGMSSTVAITNHVTNKIMIPIQAIIENNGSTFINLTDPKTGNLHFVAVKTGLTTMDSVVIESGLRNGDKIVIPN